MNNVLLYKYLWHGLCPLKRQHSRVSLNVGFIQRFFAVGRYYSGQKANIFGITKIPLKMQQAAVKDNILQLAVFCLQHSPATCVESSCVFLCGHSDVERDLQSDSFFPH